MPDSTIRTVHYGLGPIGASILRLCARRPDFAVAGAIDIDPAKVGRDAGLVAVLRRRLGVPVSADAERLLAASDAQVVVHCTGSHLAEVKDQLAACLRAGKRVISTCEELSYPRAERRAIAGELDALARERGVALLGTGVNPGFVMDVLPLALSGACQEVRSIRITRVVDAGRRRGPLQRKVGASLSLAEFRRRVREGTVRHVGLLESLEAVADALGWRLDRVSERIAPVVARRRVRTSVLEVAPGRVAGVRQVARGYWGGRARVVLELQMYVGARQPRDVVEIEGTPPLRLELPGGTHGDLATAAIVVNAIPRLLAASPGLHTMLDIPLVHAVPGPSARRP